jgi:hypothetical protein
MGIRRYLREGDGCVLSQCQPRQSLNKFTLRRMLEEEPNSLKDHLTAL